MFLARDAQHFFQEMGRSADVPTGSRRALWSYEPGEGHSAGVLDRSWPRAHPVLAASQETRTGYRVSSSVELASWESGVPRCLEEVSVPVFHFKL